VLPANLVNICLLSCSVNVAAICIMILCCRKWLSILMFCYRISPFRRKLCIPLFCFNLHEAIIGVGTVVYQKLCYILQIVTVLFITKLWYNLHYACRKWRHEAISYLLYAIILKEVTVRYIAEFCCNLQYVISCCRKWFFCLSRSFVMTSSTLHHVAGSDCSVITSSHKKWLSYLSRSFV
jgi:hypothetical protein